MSNAPVPIRIYIRVFVALLVLTALTVLVAFVDLGFFNTFLAVTIAVVKSLLVVLFFMHVWYSSRLTWVFACAGFLWLLILFAFTIGDYASRSWLPAPFPLP